MTRRVRPPRTVTVKCSRVQFERLYRTAKAQGKAVHEFMFDSAISAAAKYMKERGGAAIKANNERYRPEILARLAAANEKQRGFHVPPDRLEEYRYLTRRKQLRAKEAGRMLGLV